MPEITGRMWAKFDKCGGWWGTKDKQQWHHADLSVMCYIHDALLLIASGGIATIQNVILGLSDLPQDDGF